MLKPVQFTVLSGLCQLPGIICGCALPGTQVRWVYVQECDFSKNRYILECVSIDMKLANIIHTYRGLIFEAGSFIPQELILMCKANQSFSVMIYKCIEPCTFISKMSTFQSPSAKFSTCAILIMDIFI